MFIPPIGSISNFNHFLLRETLFRESSRELVLFACYPICSLSPFSGRVWRDSRLCEPFAKQFPISHKEPFYRERLDGDSLFLWPPNFILGHFSSWKTLFAGRVWWTRSFHDPIFRPHYYRPPFHKRSLILGSFDESLISLRKFVLQTPPLQGREEYFPFPIQVRAKPESLFLGKKRGEFCHGRVNSISSILFHQGFIEYVANLLSKVIVDLKAFVAQRIISNYLQYHFQKSKTLAK